MPELNFSVEKAQPVAFAAAPMLHFTLRINETTNHPIHAIALRCQIRIEPAHRRYQPAEQERLLDLFGPPSRWGQTLKSLLWTHAAVVVPPFTGTTSVDLPVPCSYDFNLAASKYFYAMEKDDVPLSLLFSGTIFYASPDQTLQVTQIPWDREANFRLPVRVWKEMMDHYYPNSAWLCLHKDAFDRLYRFKSRHSLTSWEAALEKLLDATDSQVTEGDDSPRASSPLAGEGGVYSRRVGGNLRSPQNLAQALSPPDGNSPVNSSTPGGT